MARLIELLFALAFSADALSLGRQAKNQEAQHVGQEPSWVRSSEPEWSQKKKTVLECDDKGMDNAYWGVWIDGRDAHKGRTVYDHSMKWAGGYEPDVRKRLDPLLAKVPTAGDKLTMEHWHVISQLRVLRKYKNPVETEVKSCQHSAFEREHIQAIMKNLTVVGANYELRVGKSSKHFDEAVRQVFDEYNPMMNSAQSVEEQLHAIAFLMRNLAYIHPFADKNGRSRMMLTQFELRRNKIGCGTMMFNNNKDIYFQTEEEFVDKLKEGIEMFNKAAATNRNPWEDVSSHAAHEARFPNPYARKLSECWKQFCVSGACKGTKIALHETHNRPNASSQEEHDELGLDAGNLEFSGDLEFTESA